MAQGGDDRALGVHHRHAAIGAHDGPFRVRFEARVLHRVGGHEDAARVAHEAAIGGFLRHFVDGQHQRIFPVDVHRRVGLAVLELEDGNEAVVGQA